MPLTRWIAAVAFILGSGACATRGYTVGGVDIEHGTARRKLDSATLVRRTAPAVGIITTDVARGMGFVIDPRGYMLTNRHVIEDADHIESISFPAHDPPLTFASVHVEYIHPEQDLALLRVSSNEPLPVLPLASHEADNVEYYAHTQDEVLLLGRQHDDDNASLTFHEGTITELFARNAAVGPGQFLGLTVPVRQGQSGGPVVDRFGRAIGVVTWTWKDRPGGFAIPIAEATRMLDVRPRPNSSREHAEQAEARAIDYLIGLARSELDTARRITSPSYARQVRGNTLDTFIGESGPVLLHEYTEQLDELVRMPDDEALFAALRHMVETAGSQEFLEAAGLAREVRPAQAITFFFEYGQAYIVARRFGHRDPQEAASIALRRLHSLDAARSFALADVLDELDSAALHIEKTEITPGLYAPRAVVTIAVRSEDMSLVERKLALQMRFEWGDWYVAEIQDIGAHTRVALGD